MKNIFKLIPLLFSLSIGNAYAAQLSVDLITVGSVDNSLNANNGSRFNVDIVLNDATDFAGFEFDLGFDNTVLAASSVTSGNVFDPDTFLLDETISAGNLSFSETTLATNGLDINIPTVIATITFDALAVGTSGLSLTNVILSDSLGFELSPANLAQGNVTVSEIPVPAAFWLFFSGILGVISFRKKKLLNS